MPKKNVIGYINAIKKLARETEALDPIVKAGSHLPETLVKEAQYAPQQKIIQKLLTGEQFAAKQRGLSKAALAGAVGASTLMTQEDAEAAGIQTIMNKLGVTKEVAQEIKTMAKNVPPDVFEQNIKAIQNVSQYKRNPDIIQELGRGIDVIAYDVGDQVVKVPRLGKLGKSWNSERMDIVPSVVEESGYGPTTKTIKTSQNKYQVQEKLSPLGSIETTHPKIVNDPLLNTLKDKELELMFTNKGQRRSLTDKEQKELFDTRKQYAIRESEIFKELNIPKDVLNNSMGLNFVDAEQLESYMKRQLKQKIGSVVEPSDLHPENVGLDKYNQMKVLDTGNFMKFDKEKMTPSMREKAIQNYIALPEEKTRFIENLNPQPSSIKKVAAIAPIAMSGEFGQSSDQVSSQEPSFLDRAKDLGKLALIKGVETYEQLPEGVKSGLSQGLTELSRPQGALMGAIASAQKGENPFQGFVKGAENPEAAPTGANIVENLGIPTEYPNTQAALATGADLLFDPLNATGLNQASKLKILGKLK